MPKLAVAWETWFETAVGQRNRTLSAATRENGFYILANANPSSSPDPALMAFGLRQFASEGGQCPPEFLQALADLFDPPNEHSGATVKITRPRGGKAAAHDTWAIGQEADELAEKDGYASAIAAVCYDHGCSETTAKQALATYRKSMAAHDEAAR